MNDPTISRHPCAQTHPSGQRVVVFHSETKDSIVLNPTGSWLWNQLESSQKQSKLIEALSGEHPEVAPQTIESDVKAYIKELSANAILLIQD